jgi:hypothetical protein
LIFDERSVCSTFNYFSKYSRHNGLLLHPIHAIFSHYGIKMLDLLIGIIFLDSAHKFKKNMFNQKITTL